MPKPGSDPPAIPVVGDPDIRLAAIAAASDAFSDAVPDIEALLDIVAEQISRTTGDFCAVVLLSPDARSIEPVAAHHPNPEVLKDAAAMLGAPIPLDASGPWKTVVTERRAVLIEIDPDRLPANVAEHQARHIKKWRMRQAAMIPIGNLSPNLTLGQETTTGILDKNREHNPVVS